MDHIAHLRKIFTCLQILQNIGDFKYLLKKQNQYFRREKRRFEQQLVLLRQKKVTWLENSTGHGNIHQVALFEYIGSCFCEFKENKTTPSHSNNCRRTSYNCRGPKFIKRNRSP